MPIAIPEDDHPPTDGGIADQVARIRTPQRHGRRAISTRVAYFPGGDADHATGLLRQSLAQTEARLYFGTMPPKPNRSPVLGYNHNLKYRGRIFHIQSEDSGPQNPRLFTHLYFGGTILASKKHEYDPAAPEDVVRALMQSQHKSILKELKAGKHDDRIIRFFTARGESLEASMAESVSAD